MERVQKSIRRLHSLLVALSALRHRSAKYCQFANQRIKPIGLYPQKPGKARHKFQPKLTGIVGPSFSDPLGCHRHVLKPSIGPIDQ